MIGPVAAQDANSLSIQQKSRAAQAARENLPRADQRKCPVHHGRPARHPVRRHNQRHGPGREDGLRLRLRPVLGNASAQNVGDLVFLRGVDLALTTIQVLDLLRDNNQYGPNLDGRSSNRAAA